MLHLVRWWRQKKKIGRYDLNCNSTGCKVGLTSMLRNCVSYFFFMLCTHSRMLYLFIHSPQTAPAHSQAGTALRLISLQCACACLFSWICLVAVTVCLPFSLWFALPTFMGSQQGGGGASIADSCRTRMLHCFCIPTKVQIGLACYCLPLAIYCLPLACYCLPLACYCLSLTAYPLATISAYPLAYY